MAAHEITELSFVGVLSVREVSVLHGEIVAALHSADRLVLDVSGATDVDLSVVQLLVAARRSAEAQGRSLVLKAPGAEPLDEALRRGGFTVDDAFWHGEGERP